MARLPTEIVALRRALGAELARYREASPLDQTQLGLRTNYSRTSISHIEHGRQFPDRRFWEAADSALGAGGALLARHDVVVEQITHRMVAELQAARHGRYNGHTEGDPQHLPRPLITDDKYAQDDVNRRELLRLMSLAGSMMTVPLALDAIDFERVQHAGKHPSQLDAAVLDDYAVVNQQLWQTYSKSTAKRAVMPAVREHLGALVASLEEVQTGAARYRLSMLAGDLFQLCGEVFFDSNRYADAAQCYTLAAAASREANAFDLWACAMTRHAFIGIYEEQHHNARVLLDGAQRFATKGDPALPTRHWVAAVQAQAHAGLGEFGACQRALDRAEQVNHLPAPVTATRGWLRFEGSRLDEERGACYVELGRPELAEPVLTRALRRSISTRRRGSVLTDLARAGAQSVDVDQVVMYGAAALDVMRQTGSAGYVGRKLTALPTQLEPFLCDRHIRHLVTQIHHTATATRTSS